jgi:phosphate:Na+ symporter
MILHGFNIRRDWILHIKIILNSKNNISENDMDIFTIIAFIGGLALFLFGMNVMGSALEKQAGGRFKRMLERLTANPLSGVILGAGITAIIQSSSATTVMVVGLVNSGIMTLENCVGIIMGANIGTSATAWILSLIGIESSNVLIQMFKPINFSPILALIGIGLILLSKSDRKKDVGNIMVGFAVLMFGMEMMTQNLKPLADVPEFASILTMFQNPVLGVLAGAVITGIIQSSSASIGILQAMSLTTNISFGAAIPIILGQNIGTCVTALLSSIGASSNAKRAALIHLYFNTLGTIIWLVILYTVNAIIGLAFLDESVNVLTIAIVHTTFNMLNTTLFLPFNKKLVRLASMSLREGTKDQLFLMLDDRFLSTPSFAVAQCRELTTKMAKLVRETLFKAMEMKSGFDEAKNKEVLEAEDEADQYEDRLGTYMVKLSARSMSITDSHEVAKLLHCIGDFERISDHAVNIVQTAEEMYQKDISFSSEAEKDLDVMYAAIKEIVDMAITCFITNDVELASQVEPLEEVIDMLKAQLRSRHIIRLQKSECTTILGFVFSDLITNFERVADHCSNIAVCILQMDQGGLDTHQYLGKIKSSADAKFVERYNGYLEKYRLIAE